MKNFFQKAASVVTVFGLLIPTPVQAEQKPLWQATAKCESNTSASIANTGGKGSEFLAIPVQNLGDLATPEVLVEAESTMVFTVTTQDYFLVMWPIGNGTDWIKIEGAPCEKPTATPVIVETPTPTATPTIVVTATPTIVVTSTPTIVVTATPTIVVTATPTIVVTATPTIVVTATPTIVVTSTPTIVVTSTPTIVVTSTPTIVVTATPTIVVTEPTEVVVKPSFKIECQDGNATIKNTSSLESGAVLVLSGNNWTVHLFPDMSYSTMLAFKFTWKGEEDWKSSTSFCPPTSDGESDEPTGPTTTQIFLPLITR